MKDYNMSDRIMTYVSELKELVDFVEKAADHFSSHPEHSTFGDLIPGSYLGLRWGLGDDCVMVVRLDENFKITNFQQAIKKKES